MIEMTPEVVQAYFIAEDKGNKIGAESNKQLEILPCGRQASVQMHTSVQPRAR